MQGVHYEQNKPASGAIFQDWEPVVIRNSSAAKEAKKHHQNPTGTKEREELEKPEVPKLDKITPEQCKVLREARNAKGLTQNDFAKSMNINSSIIRDYENGTVAKFNKTFYNNMLRRLGVKPQ